MTDDLIHHGDHSPTRSPSPGLPLRIPKNKSTGNLLGPLTTSPVPDQGRTRYSFDAGSGQDLGNLKKSTGARAQYENGLGVSGLRRIRRPGQLSRTPTIVFDEAEESGPPSLQQSQIWPLTGSSSRSVSRSASTHFLTSGPSSPVLEDLHRFPAESLHSFSFAKQTEEFLHSRQTLLQKSIDFMRDRSGWAANPGLANVQARVSGDAEIQGMMDLLRRARVVPSLDTEVTNAIGLGLGPMTGPADFEGRNIFEKSFSDGVNAVQQSARSSLEIQEKLRKGSLNEDYFSSTADDSVTNSSVLTDMPSGPRKSGMKRTYTDVNSMSLQQKLIEALAQPYTNDENSQGLGQGQSQNQSLSSFLSAGNQNSSGAPSTVHPHSSKWTPAAQAVFRTNAVAPWTILAANDLACLTFGVTRAEVRNLSILGIIQEDRRAWLEEKLQQPEPVEDKPKSSAATNAMANGNGSLLSAKGGITARLLSKAPSRTTKKARTDTDEGSGDSARPVPSKNHVPTKSRGVLLCGDIVPIRKRDGTPGAASFWVMEKRGGLIWVVEEITEDVAFLVFDRNSRLIEARGDVEPIWGENLSLDLPLLSLIPKFPMDALYDSRYDREPIIDYLTAYTMGGVNVPTAVAKGTQSGELRIASLPHIAGVMVIEPGTLKISSSNSVFSAALFGYDKPNGLKITTLIPNFASILDILTDEEEHELIDGLVVPEHSFRRARALLALREGSENAATLFLRPAGLLAKHKDGSDIMVDVQMRVVKSETIFPVQEDVIMEESSEEPTETQIAIKELVYAIWITYSRQLHSAGLGVDRPEHTLASRQVTPPLQPQPEFPTPPPTIESKKASDPAMLSIVGETVHSLSPSEPLEHPPKDVPYIPHEPKTIKDFVILEEMGKGAYGEVKLARYRRSQSKIVLKYIVKKRILVDTWTRDRRLGTVPLEIHVLDFLRTPGLQHPNIVEMVDFFEDSTNYYIEMLPHGIPGMDLFDYIELRSSMQETECQNIFRQVVDAVHHLHVKAKVVHRDIKDENVVLDGQGNIKLIDFGSATYIKNGPFDVFVGTIDYAAPEVLQGRSYGGKEQDVWALGILLYTLTYRENPFYNIDEILDHPLRVPFVPFEDSELCIDLIRRMLDRDVDERITIEDVMKHEWLAPE